MKKRNIIAILASCATVLSIFTACGSKEEDVTNPTVVGTDGKVYEEITEAVTDTEGEAVTDTEGETQVVVVTKPYTTKKAEKEKDKDKDKDKDKEKDDDKEQTPEENPATPDTPTAPGATAAPGTTAAPLFPFMTEPAGETTTTYEDVTFPEGEIVDVELNQSGRPQQSMKDKLFKTSANNKSLYMDCSVVTNDKNVFDPGMSMKIHMKDNKMAFDVLIGITTMRMAFDGKSTNIIFPATKYYYPIGNAQDTEMETIEELGFWQIIASDDMEYVKTTRVQLQGKDYLCEVYTDKEQKGEAKYYFNGKGELKRIEMISPDGASTILKVSAASSTVDDSVFTVPNGYKQLTEDDLQNMSGMLGIK